MRLKTFAVAALIACASLSASLAAEPRLFPDSQIVVRDRFSDEIIGRGPDVVFIPGLASSRETWKATAERLKDRFRVHLIQVAGFAGEPPRGNAFGPILVPTADAIDAYLVEQHLSPATVIGHSLGGTMALYLAEHHPRDIKKVMLVDVLPFYATLTAGPQVTAQSMAPIAEKIRDGKSKLTPAEHRKLMASMASSAADRAMIEGWDKDSDKTTVLNALADDLTLDLRPGLAHITVPVTLLYPDYAPAHLPKGAADTSYRSNYAAVPDIKMIRIDDSLHFVMFDQPAQFDRALDAFLGR